MKDKQQPLTDFLVGQKISWVSLEGNLLSVGLENGRELKASVGYSGTDEDPTLHILTLYECESKALAGSRDV